MWRCGPLVKGMLPSLKRQCFLSIKKRARQERKKAPQFAKENLKGDKVLSGLRHRIVDLLRPRQRVVEIRRPYIAQILVLV